MLCIPSKRLSLAIGALAALAVAAPGSLAGAPTPSRLTVQQAQGERATRTVEAQRRVVRSEVEVVSSRITISRGEAEMELELADGRELSIESRDGRIFADGRDLGPAPRGGEVERSWRDLLNRAIDTPSDELVGLLRGWDAPDGSAGERLKAGMLAALRGEEEESVAAAPLAPGVGPSSDTLARLNERLEELQERLERAQERLEDYDERGASARASGAFRHRSAGPLHYIWEGIQDLIGRLVLFAILFGVGFGAIYFGGRPYLEAVADTARRQTLRCWLVGLAGSFLVLPAFVLGTLALVISIVGIPALLVWIPIFPVAVVVAVLFGYLAFAHAAGEGLAERRLHGGEWFNRGNSYYFMLTGLGLLFALFIAGDVLQMAGPWLSFVHGTLYFLAAVLSWFAATTGFGAVLLSRAGTRPPGGAEADAGTRAMFEEESHV